MRIGEADVREFASNAANRLDFWVSFLAAADVHTLAEIGVYRGDFAARVLGACPSITRYYMIDPWRHLEDWNKPANKADDTFEGYFQETMRKTEPHEAKRVVLRGRTLDVIDQIGDGELDYAYIDGDHTLRGITTDLMRVYPKVRDGGWIGGDDFCRTIFQHSREFEPTLVFPYAVYFAEAVGDRIYALPHRQFLLQKRAGGAHEYVDVTNSYPSTTLKAQLDGSSRKGPGQPVPGPQHVREESAARRVLRRAVNR